MPHYVTLFALCSHNSYVPEYCFPEEEEGGESLSEIFPVGRSYLSGKLRRDA